MGITRRALLSLPCLPLFLRTTEEFSIGEEVLAWDICWGGILPVTVCDVYRENGHNIYVCRHDTLYANGAIMSTHLYANDIADIDAETMALKNWYFLAKSILEIKQAITTL